ncbi:bifunctional 4-hydroxy-2-oxoglutarate aldolase/2-dehydro-3-deoxy-phosphogluconate aldolase [Microbacterium sp. DT81.1]|uniref:bifunctional 4-hydroxy-2-oxoglutarate aldolase/2-dehydro-3-deoxy-phosphogluconate aldolase n=1 Tax=Microbacterium sp. DT81.1 TaxID=3393413 RepID=UPI003CEC7ABF
MSAVLDRIAEVGVIPVLRSPSADEAVAAARGLAQGGLTVLELTYSTPDVLEAIRRLSEDPDVTVGAGTVLTERQAHDAVDAGARFLVSPVWVPWLPGLARDRGVDAIPGAATPSEIWRAHDEGAVAVKVFPIARLGGAAYVRDLLAPLPSLTLMATGGVDVTAARELLAAGCIAVGVGTISVDPSDRDLAPAERARRFLAAVRAS